MEKKRQSNELITVNEGGLKTLFAFMVLGYLCMNIDHGIMPAATSEIQEFLGGSQGEIGLLGSLVYLGNAIGSILLTPIYQRYNPKYVVSFCVLFNIVTLITFTLFKSFWVMALSRVLAGIFQVSLIIYFPVWVDQNGPEKSKTMWLTLLQVSVPLGIVLGYALTGVIVSFT